MNTNAMQGHTAIPSTVGKMAALGEVADAGNETHSAAAMTNLPVAAPATAIQSALQGAHARTARLSVAQQGVLEAIKGRNPAADVEPAQALYTLAELQLTGALTGLPAPSDAPALPALPALMFSPPASGATSGAVQEESSAEFWKRISEAIGGLKENYLGAYETAVQKNNAFYKEFIHVLSQMGKWTEGDDKNVWLMLQKMEEVPVTEQEMLDLIAKEPQPFDFSLPDSMIRSLIVGRGADKKKVPVKDSGLLAGLTALLEKYNPELPANKERGVLIATDDKDRAVKWAKDMGLPEDVVEENKNPKPDGSDKWWVKLDVDPVKNMVKDLQALLKGSSLDSKGQIKLSTATYQAWKVGFDAQESSLKNTASALAQKLANAQSIYENLIKVLSGTITAMMETLKSFLQN